MDTTKLSTLPPNVQRGLEKTFNDSPRMDPFNTDSRKIQAILYGRQGCGKTVLAARIAAAYGGKICFLDAETSSEVLRDHQYLQPMAEWDFPTEFPGLNELAYLLPVWAKEGRYHTVIVDSLTSAMGLDKRDILLNAGFSRGTAPGYRELSTQQDYGVILNRLEWLFDVAIKCRMNLLVMAHAKTPSDAELTRGTGKYRIIATDNQEVAIGARIANVWYCANEFDEKRNTRIRRVYTRDTPQVEAKCRIAQLPDRTTQDGIVGRLDAWRQGIEYVKPGAAESE